MLDSTLFSHCPIGISYYGIETPLICVVTWFTKLESSQGCFDKYGIQVLDPQKIGTFLKIHTASNYLYLCVFYHGMCC